MSVFRKAIIGKLFIILSVWLMISCSGGDQQIGNPVRRSQDGAADSTIDIAIKALEPSSQLSPDSALFLARPAESLARHHAFPKPLARLLFLQGNLYYRTNMMDKALEKYAEALDLARKNQLDSLEADCLERMGSAQYSSDAGGYLSYYLNALLIYEKIGDSNGMAKVYNILGVYQTGKGEFDSANVWFQRAIAINKKSGNSQYLIENRANLAYLDESRGEYDRAEKTYNELVEELTSAHDSIGLQVIFYNLSSLYQRKGRPDTAIHFLDRAIRIAEPVHDSGLLSTLYGNKGELCLNAGLSDSAERYLRKSVLFSQSIDDPETEIQALGFLMRLDSLKGNSRNLPANLKRIIILKDTISERRHRNDNQKSRLQYEIEKRKNIIELREKQLDTAEKNKRLYFVLLLVSILAGVLIITVHFQVRKNLKKQKQLAEDKIVIRDLQVEKMKNEQEIGRLMLEQAENELETRKKVLLSIAMGNEQKNELIQNIGQRIKEALQSSPETNHATLIGEILASIRVQQGLARESDLFNQQFNSLNEKFYANLTRVHPNLTSTERRFCAYLHLGFSGSQIASKLNVTQEAIRKTRYRIRKKINLRPDQSMEDYLSAL